MTFKGSAMELFLFGWFGFGVVGSVLGGVGDRNRGIDITLGHVMCVALLAWFGPLVLVLGIVHFFQHTPPFKGCTSKVIFKGK